MGTMRTTAMALLVVGCGTDPVEPEPTYGTWQPLITKPWTLPPGGENPSEIGLIELDREIYIGGLRAISPPGTHHA